MAIKGLDKWVERLGQREMPVLANVITELNNLTGDDDTEINQLADVILKDPNLTSQVLKIANSVQYNPSSYPINTVSRAIVLIGFTGVRAICISVMVIDSLLGKQPKERLLQQMAQAFHSATQSRLLVKRTDADVQEEVFIAGLLYHLGEMAFWSTGGEAVEQVDALLDDNGLNLEEVAGKVLGCDFASITHSLAGNWNLGETLQQSLKPSAQPSSKVQAVCLGEELSRAAKLGWESAEMEDAIYKVTRFTGLSYVDARRAVEEAAEEAASVALTYGAPQVCPLIPNRQREEKEKPVVLEPALPEPLQADPELQLSVLRDLSNALMEKLDVNAIFQMVLEGLHRGIGLERVVLAFVQKDQVTAKFVLGEGTDGWREKFDFPVERGANNLFSHAIKQGEPVWVSQEDMGQRSRFYDPDVKKLLGEHPAFVSGIFLGPRCIAIFYCDRWKLGGTLREDQFQSFRHFMVQTEMSLKMLAEKRPTPRP
ncbi:HDOD domain-containing protein [Pseudomaricurvus alkylphenolicus]|uniref:HDOD domain-containing protein n=1 Tax=Pseudomaricurvus alkylphenolicus TaxID=1306991 RepID=UPI00141DD052|nr:HDOD domain-containing protein [Pseudomaricurvus alkylphenolicus]NIB43873.1 HDOD domain-containing protein [Pseudomaricurvus alkylphenolicus]